MTTPEYDLIRRAIEEGKQVIATYHGRLREMSPHALGRNKDDREQAHFYQFGGESNSGVIVEGSPANWRCMAVSELSEIELRDGDLFTADNHSVPSNCLVLIEYEIDY